MKNAIITGATGFVGVHLANELISNGVQVTALCRENGNISRLPAGVNYVFDAAKLSGSDVFYHLAWESASGPGRADAFLQSKNAQLTLNALMMAHKLGCGKFIALGTIYEKFAPRLRKSDKFSSSDFYILSKGYAHSMASQLAYNLGIKFVWCTLCHPIGCFIKPEQMMAYAVSNLLEGKSPAFGPAETMYDIVAVEDVAIGLCLAGKTDLLKREYYIGSGNPKPLKVWLEDTRKVMGVDTPIGINERPDDGLKFYKNWFDISTFANETGYKPTVKFDEAINNTARWIRKQ